VDPMASSTAFLSSQQIHKIEDGELIQGKVLKKTPPMIEENQTTQTII
jgi:hypothetical protein